MKRKKIRVKNHVKVKIASESWEEKKQKLTCLIW